MIKIASVILFFSLLTLSVSSSAAEEVSLVAMIANPEQHLNSKVVVKGVLGLSQEEGVLYLDQWSFEHMASKNGVKLHFSDKIDYSHFHGRAAIVLGELKQVKNSGYWFFVERVGVLTLRSDSKN